MYNIYIYICNTWKKSFFLQPYLDVFFCRIRRIPMQTVYYGAHVSGFRTGDVRSIGDLRPAARVEEAAAAGGLRRGDTRRGRGVEQGLSPPNHSTQ